MDFEDDALLDDEKDKEEKGPIMGLEDEEEDEEDEMDGFHDDEEDDKPLVPDEEDSY